MKSKLLIINLLTLTATLSSAQGLFQNGGSISIQAGSTVRVNGDIQLQPGSTLTNGGTVNLTGNISNSATFTSAGKLVLDGNDSQFLSGTSPYISENLVIGNPAGVNLQAPFSVSGELTFINGILDATSNGLTLKSNADYSGAHDGSHVNGYVVREGTGPLLFPVGDGTKYQPVLADLTENSDGMAARYFGADAGSGSFSGAGRSSTVLENYNHLEYWDLNPIGTATGTVTLFRDDYNMGSITTSSDLRVWKVAHKAGGYWLNEGGTDDGNGQVVSKTISTWSPFTLGVIPESALPVNWISFSGYHNDQNKPVLIWEVDETSVDSYEVQRSRNGHSFFPIGKVISRGNGAQTYNYTDLMASPDESYYRIKQTDTDGTVSFSRILNLQTHIKSPVATAWPNPTAYTTTVSVDRSLIGTQVRLLSSTGLLIKQQPVEKQSFNLDLRGLPSGLYFIQTQNGKSLKIVKE